MVCIVSFKSPDDFSTSDSNDLDLLVNTIHTIIIHNSIKIENIRKHATVTLPHTCELQLSYYNYHYKIVSLLCD